MGLTLYIICFVMVKNVQTCSLFETIFKISMKLKKFICLYGEGVAEWLEVLSAEVHRFKFMLGQVAK